MRIFLSLILFATLHIHAVFAQKAIDARAAGMAYSNAADTRGLQSVGLNPATLALPTTYRMEFNLLSAKIALNNNSIKKSQYDRYFTTGDVLTDADIDDILNSIPEKGLRADGIANINSLSIYLPNFSFAIFGVGNAKLNVPKTVFELPLKGNVEQGRIYSFDDAEGGDWVGIGASLGGATSIRWKRLPFQDLLVGATFAYYRGLHYDGIEEARGMIHNYDLENRPFVSIDGRMSVLTAEGGNGFSLSVGGLAIVSEKLSVGLSLTNALSDMSWKTDAERRILTIRGDSLSLPSRIKDSLIVDTDTTFALNGFATKLPSVMDWAIAYHPSSQVTVTAEYEQGLTDQMNGTKRPRVAMGFEYRGIPALPLRTGFTFGGKVGSSFAVGMGIDVKNWYLDVAYLNHGSILPGDYKGIGLAVSSRLRF